MKKNTYERPVAEVLEAKTTDLLLASGDPGFDFRDNWSFDKF